MSDRPTTRDEIRRRRAAVADSFAHARREFNTLTVRAATALDYVQADCTDPPEAVVNEYHGSHFKRRCSDCGKLLD